ncbi:carcinine hydrolase/isopenicillin-N N-acyltransferase family protein [Paenibacillus hodogayensis]|uniref:Carcinine hydrolase/isopenicillin-N N-acyltransferase family protein n=1 Tax=Paenibacillus hodogayensis TaxID=279208 RepID=A0ABV5VYH9_9BACL
MRRSSKRSGGCPKDSGARSSVQEAIGQLRSLPIGASQNIMMADKHGDMAVVECCSERMAVRTPKEGERFVITSNHFTEPSMLVYDGRPEGNWFFSETRYETALRVLRMSGHGCDAIELAKRILSGKLGFACQYKKEMNFDSLWSFIVRLNDLTLFRAEGNPSRVKYAEDTRLAWAMQKKKGAFKGYFTR